MTMSEGRTLPGLLRRYLPILGWGAEYSPRTVASDLVAAAIGLAAPPGDTAAFIEFSDAVLRSKRIAPLLPPYTAITAGPVMGKHITGGTRSWVTIN